MPKGSKKINPVQNKGKWSEWITTAERLLKTRVWCFFLRLSDSFLHPINFFIISFLFFVVSSSQERKREKEVSFCLPLFSSLFRGITLQGKEEEEGEGCSVFTILFPLFRFFVCPSFLLCYTTWFKNGKREKERKREWEENTASWAEDRLLRLCLSLSAGGRNIRHVRRDCRSILTTTVWLLWHSIHPAHGQEYRHRPCVWVRRVHSQKGRGKHLKE